jgi:hypothetical protein
MHRDYRLGSVLRHHALGDFIERGAADVEEYDKISLVQTPRSRFEHLSVGYSSSTSLRH